MLDVNFCFSYLDSQIWFSFTSILEFTNVRSMQKLIPIIGASFHKRTVYKHAKLYKVFDQCRRNVRLTYEKKTKH